MSRAGSGFDRRGVLKAGAAFGAALAVAGCAEVIPQSVGLALTPTTLTDPAVFNFALNLEYLEAEYYLRGMTGQGLPGNDIGPSPGAVSGGRKVAFTDPVLQACFADVANDEAEHVRYIRQAIAGSPLVELSRPAIDFDGAFRAAGQAAGLGGNFDPFADEASFLLGAFLFEDVGVTAYNGAVKLVADKQLLAQAAGILAVEGYHGGMVRQELFRRGTEAINAANAIAAARDRLEGSSHPGEGLTVNGMADIAPSDGNGIAFARSPQKVLNIVFLTPGTGVNKGGFFPRGIKGVVQAT